MYKIMKDFGFNSRVLQLTGHLISMTTIYVIVNGSPFHFFKNSKGLREGDPISPILFIIMDECLGRNLQKMVDWGSLLGLKLSSNSLIYAHQQFVDDTILMGRSTMAEARCLRKALDDYELVSSQMVNRPRQQKMARIIDCEIEALPSIYLGLPLGLKPPDSFWNVLVDRFSKKLASWKGTLLSQVGKIQLLKATLQNLPIYALSLFKIPSKYADAIEKIQKNFLWSKVEEKKRFPLID